MGAVLVSSPTQAEEQEPQGDVAPIHLNLKESQELSPETKGNPEDEAVVAQPPQSHESTPGSADCLRTKQWTDIGTWMAPAVSYDVQLGSSVSFNIWWMEDDQPSSCPTDNGDGYPADAEFRWTLSSELNGQLATHTTGESNALEPTEVTGSASVQNSTSLAKGDVLSLSIEYRAFEKIFYYFDNVSYQSGTTPSANAIVPLAAEGRSSSVTLELAQAWPIRLDEALEGYYIWADLKGDIADNEVASVEDGDEYQVNNATIKADAITWQTAYPGEATISFSYAPNGTVEPVIITVVTIKEKSDDDPGLGFGGALVALGAATTMLVRRRRRDR